MQKNKTRRLATANRSRVSTDVTTFFGKDRIGDLIDPVKISSTIV